MKLKLTLLLVALSLILTTACSQSTPGSSPEDSQENQAVDQSENMESSSDEESNDYSPTSAEEGLQGVQIFSVTGTPNTSSESTVGGEVTISHQFDENGVLFECFGYLAETFFERVSENNYQATVEDGSSHTLIYSSDGFQWIGVNADGSPRDWTFNLAE